MGDLERARRAIDRQLAKYRAARESCERERRALEEINSRLRDLQEAQGIAQAVAEQIQIQAHAKIAEIVTKSLAIFDEPYEFKIEFNRARGRTEARLLFERNGLAVDPMEASGGGVIDVAAFALRVACLALRRPPLARILILDEPFRFVSQEYRPRVRALLEILSEDLGIQFLMITHDPALQAGKVISFSAL